MSNSSQSPLINRVLRIVLVASATGVLLGSEPILSWTEQLPVTMPYQQNLQSIASSWNTLATRLKLTTPYALLRNLERQAQDIRFAPAPNQ